MNILVLSSNNGEGHNTAARALMAEARKRGHSCFMADTLMFDSPARSEAVSRIHQDSALKAPQLFKTGNEIAELMSEKAKERDEHTRFYHENSKYAPRIKKFIGDNGVDAVVATHIFAAEALTFMRNELGAKTAAYFVATDYSFTPFIPETELDAYFIPSPRFEDEFSKRAPGRVFVASGIPVSDQFAKKNTMQDARVELGLPLSAPVVMYMTGSMGRGQIDGFTKQFLPVMPPNTRLLAMCGNNAHLKKALEAEYSGNDFVLPVGYTDRVGLYIDASDLLISKPGGLSSTEAAVKEIPLVLTEPLPGWEEGNVEFFTRLGMALSGATPREAAHAAITLLQDESLRQAMTARQRIEINKYAARDIIDYVESHIAN